MKQTRSHERRGILEPAAGLRALPPFSARRRGRAAASTPCASPGLADVRLGKRAAGGRSASLWIWASTCRELLGCPGHVRVAGGPRRRSTLRSSWTWALLWARWLRPASCRSSSPCLFPEHADQRVQPRQLRPVVGAHPGHLLLVVPLHPGHLLPRPGDHPVPLGDHPVPLGDRALKSHVLRGHSCEFFPENCQIGPRHVLGRLQVL